MVTRRTRVLSAIAVVLMLVSMFTTFVLPAVAAEGDYEMPEAPANLKAYKNRTASDGLTDYAITDADDWIAAVRDSNKRSNGPLKGSKYETFEGITLWVTNDLDFGGETRTLTSKNHIFFNYYASTSGGRFKGTFQGQGHSIKGLVVELNQDWITNGNYSHTGLFCYGENATIRDLTVDSSCSFKYVMAGYNTGANSGAGAKMEFMSGVYMGTGINVTFINCHNEANLEYTDVTETHSGNTKEYPKSVSSISAFGRHASGLVMINCSNSGTIKNNDTGRAVGLAEWISYGKNNTILNSFNAGELIKISDNEFYVGAIAKSGTAQGSGVVTTVENCYAVGTRFGASSTEANSTVLDNAGESLNSDAAETGELAYLLNANHAGNYGRIYYTVDGEKTVVGTASNATVKVELDFYGTKYTGYVNAGGSVDLAELHSEDIAGYTLDDADIGNAALEDGILTVTSAPADFEINVALISNEVQLDALKAAVAVRKADGAENYTYTGDTYTGTLDELLAAIETKIADFESDPKGANAYVNNSEVLADLAVLEEFVLSDVISINLYERYPDHAGFAVASKADMEYLATVYTGLTTLQTIHITADINMEGTKDTLSDLSLSDLKASINGGNKTISNLWIKGALLGNYDGPFIRDLTFKDSGVIKTDLSASSRTAFLIDDAEVVAEYRNLTFDNVTSSADTASLTTGAIQGLVIACIDNGNVTLKDITIINSTLSRPQAGAESEVSNTYWNSGIVVGKSYKGTLNADGLYLNGNTILGKRTSTGTGIVFGELICTATVKNVIVTNTNVDAAYLRGVVLGKYKNASNGTANPVATLENIITYNNGNEPNFMSTDATDTVETINISNVFTDCEMIHDTELSTVTMTDCNVNQTTSIGNGLAAWTLNQTESTKSYSMDGTTPIFASETAKATVAVTFKALDAKLKDTTAPIASYKHFTDKDGKITVPQSLLDFASWDNEAGLSEATYDVDTVVYGYTTPAHDHQLSYTDNGDGTHTAECTFSHTDEELNETFTCDYSEINNHDYELKNISLTNTEEAGAHRVVDACIYCDFETDWTRACEGTLSVNDEESWAATCAGAGQTTTVCSACDYKHVKVEAQLPHTWGNWTHIEGTDTHKRTCANVENCQVPDQVEGCVFENWAETVPPTVAGPGEKTGYCTCGNIKKEPVPALTGILLNPGKAIVGNVLEVEVNIENNEKTVAGVELAITYNADLLTLQGAKSGKWDVVFDDRFPAASGLTTIDFNVISNAGMDGDGTVVVLQFAVINDEAYAGALTDLKVAVNEAYDMDFNPMRFAEANATIEIETALIKGDIDGNRFVNMADAILLLRYYTEKPQGATQYTINNLTITDKIADITDEGDGVDLGEGQFAPEVNINDVLHLLRYLNGWYTDAEFFGE